MKRHRLKLPILLLHTLWYAGVSADYTWVCSGKESQFTHHECGGDYYQSYACFYVEHFAQYRSCSSICDGVETWSMRCRDLCHEYLRKNCQSSKDIQTQPAPPETHPTTTLSGKPADLGGTAEPEKSTPPDNTESMEMVTIILPLVLCAVLVLILLTLTVYRLLTLRRRRNGGTHLKDNKTLTLIPSAPMQVTDKDYDDRYTLPSVHVSLVEADYYKKGSQEQAMLENSDNKLREMV